MNFFDQQIAYLRDNPQGYWFKRKLYGWGWTPARWQGWLVLLAFLGFEVWNFVRLDSVSHSGSDTLRPFIIETALAVLVLILVCHAKGESPKWQWGLPKDTTQSPGSSRS
ncbi:MAG: hypothetical protein AAB442_00650 [Patescibacteria group bacterium]